MFFAEIFIMQVYQAIVATPDTLVKTLLSFYPLQKYCLSCSKKTEVQDLYALSLAHDTLNIYRYKAIRANATSSVILYTGKCISPCLEIL